MECNCSQFDSPSFLLPSVCLFFKTVCPLSQIHHDFSRGKHLAPLGCYTTLSFADKNNTKVIQSKHKPTFGVTVNYVL